MTRNQVRIIGGLWKGRKLRFAAGSGLRPTPARVRETLFNWLGPDIEGSDCLDLFAGSGALGFEALSRGARSLTSVDDDRRAAESLRRNGAQLGAARLAVRRQDALAFLRRTASDGAFIHGEPIRTWDCIFLDPPFASGLLTEALALLGEGQALKPGGQVYFEARRNAPLDLRDWQVEREGHAGDCRFGLLRRGGVLAPEVRPAHQRYTPTMTGLERVCHALSEAGVHYAVVGGYAVALHGAPRGTIDIDLALRWTLEDLRRAEAALNGVGLTSSLPATAQDIHDHRAEYINERNLVAWNFHNPDDPLEQVDIVIVYDLSGKRTKPVQLSTTTVRILSLDDLISMKRQSGRAQDLEDAAALEKLR